MANNSGVAFSLLFSIFVTPKSTVIGVLNFQERFHGHYEEFHLSYNILSIFVVNHPDTIF